MNNIIRTMTGFLGPNMDYSSVGFDLGFFADHPAVHHPVVPVHTPAIPETRYESPNPAPSGFSYTPNEKDTFVCPNCDNELRTGDDDVERSVWVIKACGHVSDITILADLISNALLRLIAERVLVTDC